MKHVLLLFDIQNDYFPSGAMDLSYGGITVAAAQVQAACLAALGGPFAQVQSVEAICAELANKGRR